MPTKTLKTERLTLRKFCLEDAEQMFKNWASDDEVTRFLTWPTHKNVEVTRSVIQYWLKNYEKDDYYNWAIEYDKVKEPIGNISVVAKDTSIGMYAVGYCIGRKYWNQGITSEAMQAVIDYLFTIDGVNRIESRHDVFNPHSGMVMKKCGMIYEGTLRQFSKNNTGIYDCCYYSILKKDYEK